MLCLIYHIGIDLLIQTSVRKEEEPLLVDPAQQPNGIRSTPVIHGSPTQQRYDFNKSPTDDLMNGWDHDD